MIEPTLSTSTPPPEEDVTTTLYRAAIGPVSNGYYLPIFTRFEAADRASISWNTAASLLTLNWLVFRKLWVAALAYVGALVTVGLLVFGIGHLVFQFSDALLMALGVGFGLATLVLPGLFGNALFHTECRKAMAKALTGHTNVADARDALLIQASDRKRLIKLAAANIAVLVLAGLAYLQFAALSSVAVLPQGALEAGNVGMNRAIDPPTIPITLAPANMASAVVSPAAATAASAAASASEPAASAAVSQAESAPASAPAPSVALAASAPESAASTPVVPKAKAALAVASAPKTKPTPPKPIAAKASAKAASAPSTSESAKAPTKSFFINVGLFGVPENAAKAHAKLLEAGLPSVMKELKAKTRQIRVRVGPFATSEQADSAAQKIKALQLEASIIQL